MRKWIDLGKKLPVDNLDSSMEWKSIQLFWHEGFKMIGCERRRMKQLLKSSSFKFRPLHDPLEIELGTHRWLAREREEAYSDWMKWILEQLSEPRIIGEVLGVRDQCLHTLPGEIRIGREVGIKDIEGQPRRTDLDISFGGIDTFRVEVKKGDAGLVDCDQLRAQEHLKDFKYYILIVSSGEVRDYDGDFKVRCWKDICQELRRTVGNKRLEDIAVNAMILGFVGAVEQNILGFPGNLHGLLDNGRVVPLSVRDHIAVSL